MKYDQYFATQYKECFVYFGIPVGTSEAETDNQPCTMSGCVATLVEVDKKDGYIWSSMPQLSLPLRKIGKGIGTVKLCGGYTCGNEIALFATVNEPKYNHGSDFITKCWTTTLAKPSLRWTENTPGPLITHPQIGKSESTLLFAVRKCKQYIIYFYLPRQLWFRGKKMFSLQPSSSFIIVTDEQTKRSGVFSTDSLTYDGHISCAIVDADLFVVSGDKMAKVEKFSHLLFASAEQNTTFSISFDLNVPHANSTLFVIRDILCVLGGCDEDYDEPFSGIFQFDQGTHKWNECGVCAMARYGASVVPFTDRNQKEAVIIAGGFKAKNAPCGTIEVLSVVFNS